MKIVRDCWNKIDTYNCQYGAHIFDGSTAKIYVNQWLAPSKDLLDYFHRKNDEGYAGHCLLVFRGVRKFDFSATLTHGNKISDEYLINPITSHYYGHTTDRLEKYLLEGSLHGFPSSVLIFIEAQEFELHILEIDEPARQS